MPPSSSGYVAAPGYVPPNRARPAGDFPASAPDPVGTGSAAPASPAPVPQASSGEQGHAAPRPSAARAADPRVVGYDLVAESAAQNAQNARPAPYESGSAPYNSEATAQESGSTAPESGSSAYEPGSSPDSSAPTEHHTPPRGTTVCAACRAGGVDRDGYCETCGHAQPRERDHLECELHGVAAVSDRGHRHHRNEDFFSVSTTTLADGSPAVIAVVCDGVSSATRPDDASAAAAEAAGESLLASLPRGTHPQQALHDAIITAGKAVNSLAAERSRPQQHDPHRRQNAPACTLVAAVVGGGLLTVGWVGDSRAYWVPDDRTAPAARLTEDDSWAAQMVANNLMSEAEAYADDRAHAITGWLGADAYELEPHTASFRPDGPGVVVVCTDGLWNYAEAAADLAAVLPADAAARPLHGARTLVGHALDGGGHDNVTVAVVPFPAPQEGTGTA
ncbi:PP2C family serine/threonine-protein phosphatase [Streptomyces sp. MST-110588]|uniref:PP2C family protein-serine/threonine phosphatase n=1 Tax=Streptomyces sp. MST-110588 TaxID=2833628 RepID=UPI00205724C3|nr:serine/threonine-protein phosphatase [Streptomyces sp. MST-110588]